MFFVIFVSLLRKKNISNNSAEQSFKRKLRRQFIVALALSLLFGLGWGVGMVATTSIPVVAVSYVLQAIFILLTSFQGILIFVMNCVRSSDAQNEWKRWIKIISCHKMDYEDYKKHLSGLVKYQHKGSAIPVSSTLPTKTSKSHLEGTLNGVSTLTNSTIETAMEVEKKDPSLGKQDLSVDKELPPHREDEDDDSTAGHDENITLTFQNPSYDCLDDLHLEAIEANSPAKVKIADVESDFEGTLCANNHASTQTEANA